MADRSPPTADEMIERLDLQPHPEGGHFRETWRGERGPDGRAVGTAILFLLAAGERSHWHRVDAAEVWLFHEGDPLRLAIATDDGPARVVALGSVSTGMAVPTGGASDGAVPQAVVPSGAWQSAEPARTDVGWSLVSCVVAPGFRFEGFELAPAGWAPAPTRPDVARPD